TDKRYSGDNRLILPKSPHRREGLAPRCRLVASWGWGLAQGGGGWALRGGGCAPRCRLVASWGWSWSQGLGCSPIKAVRELGSERRETVRSLSTVRVGELRGVVPSTRGPGRTDLWWTCCPAKGTAG